MNRLIEWVKDKKEQVLELAVLPFVFLVPFVIDLQSVIVAPDKPGLDMNALLTYYAAIYGNLVIGAILVVGVFMWERKKNSRRMINNKGNRYHTHGMMWYRFCSRVLGYGSCSLVRVPIVIQFKLILYDVFDEYYVGETEIEDSDTEGEVQRFDAKQASCTDVNIMISDTCLIDADLLPDECRDNETIILSHNPGIAPGVRRYSPKLVDRVTAYVRQLPSGVRVNVFATTNPKNTYKIVEKTFKTGGRDNLGELYVYQQLRRNGPDDWSFSDGVKVL